MRQKQRGLAHHHELRRREPQIADHDVASLHPRPEITGEPFDGLLQHLFVIAAADFRHALRLSEGLRLPEGDSPTLSEGEGWAAFSIACAHAALAGLAGQEGTGVSAAQGEDHAAQAMALLRKAFDGLRDIRNYRTEGALDPLCEREDFKKLLTELEQKSAAKPK